MQGTLPVVKKSSFSECEECLALWLVHCGLYLGFVDMSLDNPGLLRLRVFAYSLPSAQSLSFPPYNQRLPPTHVPPHTTCTAALLKGSPSLEFFLMPAS